MSEMKSLSSFLLGIPFTASPLVGCHSQWWGKLPWEHKPPTPDDTIFGRDMFVHTWVKTWYVADEDCRSKGMQLVTINSEIENVQVKHLEERFDLEVVWIGGMGNED